MFSSPATMINRRVNCSILSILSCASEEFSDFYEGPYVTNALVKDAKEVISHNLTLLQGAREGRYRLDELLLGMLDHAPDPSGQRYVASVLHIANKKGISAVVDAGKAWLDYLFLPMLTLSETTKTVPSNSPTLDAIQVATRAGQHGLEAAVTAREQYRCAITKDFDFARAMELTAQGKEVPPSAQRRIQVEHIIPIPLNKFNEETSLEDAAYTWGMLQAWAGLGPHLMGSNINSPENCIFMNDLDHFRFGSFSLYFDKDEYPDSPNKYKVRMARMGRLASGQITADVEFLTNTGVPSPNPRFLKIHAAFAKVLARSQAAVYGGSNNQRVAPTDENAENDFAMLIRYKLQASGTP